MMVVWQQEKIPGLVSRLAEEKEVRGKLVV
jgi:hypothetical protein